MEPHDFGFVARIDLEKMNRLTDELKTAAEGQVRASSISSQLAARDSSRRLATTSPRSGNTLSQLSKTRIVGWSPSALDGLKGFVEVAILGDGILVALGQELVTQTVEHSASVVVLQAHDGRTFKARRAREPASQLNSKRSLALAAGAANHRPRLAV